VSSFRLDKYEITNGRFRKFMEAWLGGWRPAAGGGKHAHLNGGSGLVGSSAAYETGWSPAWNAYVGAPSATAEAPSAPAATTIASWSALLTSASFVPSIVDANPVVLLSWYDAYAFCIWDGGFLPSDAEREYAAAGGSEERVYPWGSTVPSADTQLANHGCYAAGGCGPRIPGASPSGAGRWGHMDLAGNVHEWTVDPMTDYLTVCVDCTLGVGSGSARRIRGGGYGSSATQVTSAAADAITTAQRSAFVGARCARTP
jgi:formylglycine-generating enzyme required for sulfatase activity